MSPNVLSERLHPLDGIRREDIRITNVTITPLSYRLKREEQWPDGDNHAVIWKTTTMLVRVYTDAGFVGIGGASRYNGPEAMAGYLDEAIKPWLVGRNPFDVERLSSGKSDHGARGVWSGIDVALWDIIGQAKGLPVYKLLATDNGPDPQVPVYASGGEYSWQPNTRFDTPESLVDKARRHKAAGYKAFKFRMGAGFAKYGVTMQQYIPLLYRIREAVGDDFDLIQEANCRWSLEQCLEIAPVLEELGFLWFEEPMNKRRPESIANYLRLKQELPHVMISGGENVPCRSSLAEWVDRHAYDIVQQGTDDAGMTEAWHMAQMAHQRGILCCAHNWQGDLVTIANAHLMAAIPNRLLLESNMTPNPLKEGLFKEPLAVRDGILTVPDRPGLGVELREDLEERFPYIPGPWNLAEEALD